MRFHLVTLFKEACEPYLSASILGRARKNKRIGVSYQNPRDFVDNRWGKVDERPYGGGPGMVMTALPVAKAVAKALGAKKSAAKTAEIIWFSPSGKPFTNKDADKLAKAGDVVLVCGRYEGIDERAFKILKTMGRVKVFSVGSATLTGGEVPALAIIDAVTRRIPGVLGKDESVEERRVASSEVYTRPESLQWKGKKYRVPKVLQSGHQAKIDEWRVKRGK
ncbi:MAG: tRNA (guanosine(37)-N1)-methyltransferase TrmD [bacterium]